MAASLAEARSHTTTPEVFLKHDAEIRTAKRDHADTAGAILRVKKAAKAASVDPTAYKFLDNLRKLDDDEQIIVLRKVFQYCTWLEMPIGAQFSLLDAPKVIAPKGKAKAEHAVWAAGEAGRKAGRDGDAADANPFPPGTETFDGWARNHTLGLGERATASGMADTEGERPADTADATRKAGQGRGRGKKTMNGGAGLALQNARSHLEGRDAAA